VDRGIGISHLLGGTMRGRFPDPSEGVTGVVEYAVDFKYFQDRCSLSSWMGIDVSSWEGFLGDQRGPCLLLWLFGPLTENHSPGHGWDASGG